jgi:hypothetical protein
MGKGRNSSLETLLPETQNENARGTWEFIDIYSYEVICRYRR